MTARKLPEVVSDRALLSTWCLIAKGLKLNVHPSSNRKLSTGTRDLSRRSNRNWLARELLPLASVGLPAAHPLPASFCRAALIK